MAARQLHYADIKSIKGELRERSKIRRRLIREGSCVPEATHEGRELKLRIKTQDKLIAELNERLLGSWE